VFAAIVIWKQLNFIQSRQLGFNKNQQLILPLQSGYLNSEPNYTRLKNELVKFPEVKSVSAGSAYPGIANLNDMLFYREGNSKQNNVDVHVAAVENNYIQTLGFQLLSGRAFSNDFSADSASIILNETAVKKFGYTPANIIGKSIKYDVINMRGSLKVIGVVKDFNYESLHSQVQPFGFTTGVFSNKYSYMIVNLSTTNYAGALKETEQAWMKLYPGVPFEYSFLDQDFQRNYEKEQSTSAIVTYFTIIAILIACLGLFGLSAFSAEQRIKEIGVRKVLGASAGSITMLLSKDFIRLVCIAILIASPLGWWAMNKWLQNFAYKTHVSWWVFAVAGIVAVIIALITVSFQAIKAAIANPVESLRSE
jgi:putative ABC transport system permease protein